MNDPIVLATRQTFSGVSSVSEGIDISGWTQGADWTLFLLLASCFNGVVTVAIEDSQDGFIADIQTIASLDITGPLNPPCDVGTSWRKRELPSSRVGVQGAEARVKATSQSLACTITLSAEIK